MPRIHLTDIVVSRLTKPGTYFDTSTLAFAIRVGKNRKTWFVIRGRERLRTNIGTYPQTSLADARKEAKRLLTEPEQGTRIRFGEAYEKWKETIGAKKPRTQRDYKRMMDKYLMPRLEKKRLGEIQYDDIAAIVSKLSKSEASHCLAVGRTFFRWCVRPPRRYIIHSPLEGVQVAPARKRKRVLTETEVKKVWGAAVAQGYPHGTIVQLLILTGQRRGEVVSLRWPWIDEKEQTITLPETLTKNRKEHVVPFSDETARVLGTIPRRNTTDLLFPSAVSEARPLSGWSKYKKQMADGVEGWTLHDLRRTMRTFHAQLGTPAHIGERLINHAAAVQTDVEAIYDRYRYMPEMKAAVEKYERFVRGLVVAT